MSRWLTLLLLICSNAPVVADEQAPDLELLEYLGQWEREDGSWSDPMEEYPDREPIRQNETDIPPVSPQPGGEQ